tara:strand:- start:279 stop:581 length:303 start_codon:yes stop_codon:yes gene_type:complete
VGHKGFLSELKKDPTGKSCRQLVSRQKKADDIPQPDPTSKDVPLDPTLKDAPRLTPPQRPCFYWFVNFTSRHKEMDPEFKKGSASARMLDVIAGTCCPKV